MPYVGADPPPPRKRRWEDDHDVYRLYSPDGQGDIYVLDQQQALPARKIMPMAKRARFTDDEVHIHSDDSAAPTHRRRPSQQKILLQDQPGLGNKTTTTTTRPTAVSLTPCYICHRRPTKRSDLDSFAACQGCGERACYVCIRGCQGWNADDAREVLSEQEVLSRSFHMDDADDEVPADGGHQHSSGHGARDRPPEAGAAHRSRNGWDAGAHRAVVCSRCCIERGAEGDVVCLGCLSGMEGA